MWLGRKGAVPATDKTGAVFLKCKILKSKLMAKSLERERRKRSVRGK